MFFIMSKGTVCFPCGGIELCNLNLDYSFVDLSIGILIQKQEPVFQ